MLNISQTTQTIIIGMMQKYLEMSGTVGKQLNEIPDRLGFSRHIETRLKIAGDRSQFEKIGTLDPNWLYSLELHVAWIRLKVWEMTQETRIQIKN